VEASRGPEEESPGGLVRGQDGEAAVHDGADHAVQLRAALRVRPAQGFLPQAHRLVQGQERQGVRADLPGPGGFLCAPPVPSDPGLLW